MLQTLLRDAAVRQVFTISTQYYYTDIDQPSSSGNSLPPISQMTPGVMWTPQGQLYGGGESREWRGRWCEGGNRMPGGGGYANDGVFFLEGVERTGGFGLGPIEEEIGTNGGM